MPRPPEWDPDEATERIRVITHAYPQHKEMIEEVLSRKPPEPHPCKRCEQES